MRPSLLLQPQSSLRRSVVPLTTGAILCNHVVRRITRSPGTFGASRSWCSIRQVCVSWWRRAGRHCCFMSTSSRLRCSTFGSAGLVSWNCAEQLVAVLKVVLLQSCSISTAHLSVLQARFLHVCAASHGHERLKNAVTALQGPEGSGTAAYVVGVDPSSVVAAAQQASAMVYAAALRPHGLLCTLTKSCWS